MDIFLYNPSLRGKVDLWRNSGSRIAFVPTMGALHEGHLSLLDIAKKHAQYVICSIFVNPTQFNESSDLEKYPRPIESDIRKLIDRGCDLLYLPELEEVYPQGLSTDLCIELEGLDNRLEGRFRPGHFSGMMQVVKRLLDIVRPDYLIMGQKDYQQFQIVRKMIQTLSLPVELVIGPIVRESHGLAMSSRNERLSGPSREKAAAIYRTLLYVKEMFGSMTSKILIGRAVSMLEEAGLKPEYIEIVDGHDLSAIDGKQDAKSIVVCAAAWIDRIRLIDNMIIK